MRPMLRWSVLGVVIVLLGAGTASLAADYYRLSNVKRVEQDLYKSGNLYIETKFCYHYTYGEEAILKWDFEGSIENKIIWEDDSSCAVKGIFRR